MTDYPITKERFYSLVCAAVDALTNIPDDRLPETTIIIWQEVKNMVDEINQSNSPAEKKEREEELK
jgi:hypothetical protein